MVKTFPNEIAETFPLDALIDSVKMPPKRRYKICIDIKTIRRGKPVIIIPAWLSNYAEERAE